MDCLSDEILFEGRVSLLCSPIRIELHCKLHHWQLGEPMVAGQLIYTEKKERTEGQNVFDVVNCHQPGCRDLGEQSVSNESLSRKERWPYISASPLVPPILLSSIQGSLLVSRYVVTLINEDSIRSHNRLAIASHCVIIQSGSIGEPLVTTGDLILKALICSKEEYCTND